MNDDEIIKRQNAELTNWRQTAIEKDQRIQVLQADNTALWKLINSLAETCNTLSRRLGDV